MKSVNCRNDQHDKIYLHRKFQKNGMTHFGVTAPEMSIFSKFGIFQVLSQKVLEIDEKCKLQK